MARSSAAYRLDGASQRRTRTSRDNLRVVRGKKQESVSPQVITMTRAIVAVVCAFALMAFACVGMAAATVDTVMETQTLSEQVDSLKSANSQLEVQQSTLTSPSHVKEVASEELGMVEAYGAAPLVLSPDVVAYDSEGNLSLSESLAAAAAQK